MQSNGRFRGLNILAMSAFVYVAGVLSVPFAAGHVASPPARVEQTQPSHVIDRSKKGDRLRVRHTETDIQLARQTAITPAPRNA
jgi:hypothetical protein